MARSRRRWSIRELLEPDGVLAVCDRIGAEGSIDHVTKCLSSLGGQRPLFGPRVVTSESGLETSAIAKDSGADLIPGEILDEAKPGS